MAAIVQALAFVLGKFVALASWIGLLAVAVFVALWDFIRDACTWVFDQIIGIAYSAIAAVDTSGPVALVTANSSVPADIANALGALGFGTAFEMVAGAILIRFTLQLIPFTRLGS